MQELSPYRPAGTIGNLSSTSSSFVTKLSIPLIILWWVIIMLGVFPTLDAFADGPLMCMGFGGMVLVLLGGTFGIYTGVAWLWKKAIRIKIDAPQVLADDRYIRRGQMIDILYIQPFKQQTALEGISMRLVRREWVKYQRGTDTVTEKHEEVLQEHTRPAQVVSKGHKLKEQVQFQIPRDAMHSFDYEHNRLTWLVVIQTKIQTWPDMYDEYELILPSSD